MKRPAFALTGDNADWLRRGRTLERRIDDVAFVAQAPLIAGRWTVTGTSALLLPAHVTVYITRAGAAHGFWKNASIGLRDYFAYSDTPALVPLLIGERTRGAIRAHDLARVASVDVEIPGSTVALHIHDGMVETITRADRDDTRVIDDHLAIHRALAADHEAVLDAWRAAADALGGTVSTSWPPVLTVPREFGSTTISLHWSPSTHSSARASIELAADARGAKLWSLERDVAAPSSREIAGHHFLVMGTIPIPLDQLARTIARADIISINVRRSITVSIAHHAPDAATLEAVLVLMAALCGAPSEPYR